MKQLIIFLLVLISQSEAYKILVHFPLPAKSHSILGHGYVRNLLEAGHEVTYVTSMLYENPPANLTQIDITSMYDEIPSDLTNIKNIVEGNSPFTNVDLMLFMVNELSITALRHENVTKLITDTQQKFDAVVAEWFASDLVMALGPLYQCPVIISTSTELHFLALAVVDEYMNPAYTADIQSTNFAPLNFLERVEELWTQIRRTILFYYIHWKEERAYRKYLGPAFEQRGIPLPDYSVVIKNTSMLLANAHPSLGFPITLPANAKNVGGYHVNPKPSPLPKDLQDIMDNAKHGVILFSMGSNLKSKDMPNDMKKELLQVFSELKETVIWKFEENLPGLPGNVVIRSWLPQQSILAHPKIKFFISHGGLLSTTEAIHYGIPIIGIPVFGDQFANMNLAKRKGYAIVIQLGPSMPQSLRAAVTEMLSNNRYATKAKELSAIYHDRPVPPGKELVHWIEHTVRTRGATHLRSPAIDTPVYQKLFLDLIALIVLGFVVLYFAAKKICKLVCNKSINKTKKIKKN